MSKSLTELRAVAKQRANGKRREQDLEQYTLIERLFLREEKDAIEYARDIAESKIPQRSLRGEFKPDSEKIAALANTLAEEAKEIISRIQNRRLTRSAIYPALQSLANDEPFYQVHPQLCTCLWIYGCIKRYILKNNKAPAERYIDDAIRALDREDYQLKIVGLLDYFETNQTVENVLCRNQTGPVADISAPNNDDPFN